MKTWFNIAFWSLRMRNDHNVENGGRTSWIYELIKVFILENSYLNIIVGNWDKF
jgi:hypothetical protein